MTAGDHPVVTASNSGVVDSDPASRLLIVHPDLYISMNSQPDTTMIGGALNHTWERIGELDGSRETEAWKRVRPFIGLGGGSSRGFTFWADADAASNFVQGMTARAPGITQGLEGLALDDVRFWLALDLSERHNKFLVTSARARLKAAARRPPEAHPGIGIKPVFLPMHIAARDGSVFWQLDA